MDVISKSSSKILFKTYVAGLRVADASVFPTQTTGNPEAVILMVGERCAAMIKEDWQ